MNLHPNAILSRAFVAAVNHLLANAEWARERLLVHPGKNVQLVARPVELHFAIAADGLLRSTADSTAADVTLSVPLADAPRFLGGDMSRAMNAVRIEGNAELADALGFVFRNLRWDVEEDLARVVGDIAAHRIVRSGAALRDAHQRAWQAAGANIAEYFADEQGMLLTRHTLSGLADELRALRDDVARLEKRVARAEGHHRPQRGLSHST